MGTRLDWTKARKLDVSEPGYKEARLERAADNWLDHGTLYKNQKPKQRTKHKKGK